MKNLFTSKSIKISSFKMFLAFIFSLVTIFPLSSFSQQPTPTLAGFECHFFNPDGQNALRCGTVITATVDLPDSVILSTFTLTIPNSFEVIASNNCNLDIVTFADTTNYGTGVSILPGQLVRVQFTPNNFTSQCIIKLAYRSCNVYDTLASNASINTNNLFFNCEGLLPSDITIKRPTISANFQLVNNIAAGYIIDAKNSFRANMNATDSLFFLNKINDIENSGILAEELNKEVLTILSSNVSFINNIYNSQTLSRLKQIANYCPYTKGSAVYTARHILASINPTDVFYINPCEIPVSSNGARIAKLDADDEIEFNKSKQSSPIVKNEKLTIIPNPNNGYFYIQTNLQDLKRVELWSIDGKFIQELNYIKNQEVFVKEIDKGMYVLKAIDTNGKFFISKLIIQ
jgi:hypothetical protein